MTCGANKTSECHLGLAMALARGGGEIGDISWLVPSSTPKLASKAPIMTKTSVVGRSENSTWCSFHMACAVAAYIELVRARY